MPLTTLRIRFSAPLLRVPSPALPCPAHTPQTGPGSSLLSVNALATSIFLAPLSEPCPPRLGEALSLVTPLLASVRLETITAAPSWRRAGPAERWAGMQGGERTRAGRRLAAAAAAAAAKQGEAPIPPREASPQPPTPAEKAAVAAAEVQRAEMEERAAVVEPATISRSVSAVIAEATETRLRRWKKTGVVELHGPGVVVGAASGEREDEGVDTAGEGDRGTLDGWSQGGAGGMEARLSLSDVKLLTDSVRLELPLGETRSAR